VHDKLLEHGLLPVENSPEEFAAFSACRFRVSRR